MGTPEEGRRMQEGMKKSRFSINISLYLGNDTRYGQSYNRMRIENRARAFKWHHFQWFWTTPNPNLKVAAIIWG